MVNWLDQATIIANLEELLAAARRGDPIKGGFRLYRVDGTYEDVVLGAESEEERQVLLADIDSRIKSGAN